MIAALSSPLWMVAHATGDIKNYQIVISTMGLIVLPSAFLIFHFGYPPYYILAVQVVLNIAIYIYRLFFAREKVGMSIKNYIKEVVLKCLVLTICIIPIPLVLSLFAEGFMQNLCVVLLAIIITGTVFYYGGLDKDTRKEIKEYMKWKLQRISGSPAKA